MFDEERGKMLKKVREKMLNEEKGEKKKNIKSSIASIVLIGTLGTGGYLMAMDGKDAVSVAAEEKGAVLMADLVNASFQQVGGRVNSVNITEEQKVKKGTVLMTLDSKDIDLQIEKLKVDIAQMDVKIQQAKDGVKVGTNKVTTQEQEARLGIESAEAAESLLNSGTRAEDLTRQELVMDSAQQAVGVAQETVGVSQENMMAAQATVETAEENVKSAQVTVKNAQQAEKSALQGVKIAQQTEKSALQAVKSAQESEKSAQQSLDFAQTNYNRMQSLLSEGLISQADLEKAKKELDNAKNQLQSAKIQVETMGIQVETAKAQIENANNQIETTKNQTEIAKNQVEAAKKQVDAAKKQTEGLKNQTEVAKKQVGVAENKVLQEEMLLEKMQAGPTSEERKQVQVATEKAKVGLTKAQQAQEDVKNNAFNVDALVKQKKSMEVQLKSVLEQKKRLTLTAPVDGKVTRVVPKVGENVAAGSPVVMIETDQLYYELYVDETQISKLKVGENVPSYVISLDKDIKGKVRYITSAPQYASIRMSGEKGQSDISSFLIRVDMERTPELLQGMTVEVKLSEPATR
jgi:multidrug resistance efflux pump